MPMVELLSPDQVERFEQDISDMLAGYRHTLNEDRRQLFDQYRMVEWPGRSWASVRSGTGPGSSCCSVGDGDDPLFLQAKEAQASVLEDAPAVGARHAGQRVVVGQHLMQASSDVFLGWQRVPADTSIAPASRTTTTSASWPT